MRLDIVTLFPNMCTPLQESISGRAQEKGLVDIRAIDLRMFAHDRRQTTDLPPYGGGSGMVIKPEPVAEAIASLRTPETRVIMLTPQGRPFSQKMAERLSGETHVILVSGHYEGIDDRVGQSLVDEEISIGDYILTNGTLAALVVADAVIRLVPGVLGDAESAVEESFVSGSLLEYPQYTKPEKWEGMTVPGVLLSGNHNHIATWRRGQRFLRTLSRRPDLFERGMENTP
jgi:tRNA (guanine37-N1)-methyltransferase